MKPRTLLTIACVYFWSSIVVFSAEKEKVVTRVFSAPVSMFREVPRDPQSVGAEKIKGKLMSRTRDGESRYDMSEWLTGYGVEKVTGVFLDERQVFVARGPVEGVDLVERLLEIGCNLDVRDLKQIELSVQFWVYESDARKEAPVMPRTMAEVRAQAGESLRLVDQQSMLTKSGNRFVSESWQDANGGKVTKAAARPEQENGSAQKGNEKPEVAREDWFEQGARGSSLEAEPNIDPSGEAVDFQIAYRARVAQGDGEPDTVVTVSTNSTAGNGRDLMVFGGVDAPAKAGGKRRHRVVNVHVRLLDWQGRTQEEAKKMQAAERKAWEEKELERDREIAVRALEGL